jgi:hypothetical protein
MRENVLRRLMIVGLLVLRFLDIARGSARETRGRYER